MSTKEDTRQRIGQRVALLRNAKGMTQEEVANLASITRSHVGRIEDGRYGCQIETLQAVAEALGMTVDIVDPRLQDLTPLKKMGE